jgi:4-amino-4-deoxy-L-arabinose transferase-like glycosyltransferase
MGIAGPASLKFFNLILLVIFLPSFYFLIRKHYGDNEAVVACLLITFSPVLAVNTVRLTTEMLSMFCIFFSFFFAMVAIKKTDKFHAAFAGLFTGMLMLSKQAGFVVLGFYVLLLCWFFWKDQKSLRVLLIVIGVAVCTYSPYLIWAIYNKVEVLGFVSAFLGLTEKPEWSAMALKSFHKYNSGLMEFIHLFYKGNQWVITVSLFLPFYHFIRRRLKDEPQNYFFILLLYLALVMMVWHITNKRHTIILLPLIAFLVGYSMNQIVKNKLLIKALIMLLLFFAGLMTFHMPNYRQQSNGPEEFIDMAKIVKEDNGSDFRLLCLRKFDAIMYAQKPVIWPHPKLRKIPIDLVEKQSAGNLFTILKKYQIKYILIEVPLIIKSDEFYSGKYPLYFVRTCERLEQQGKIAFVAMAKSRRYVLLKVV